MRSRTPRTGARQGRRGQVRSQCGGSDCQALRRLRGEAALCSRAGAPGGGSPGEGGGRGAVGPAAALTMFSLSHQGHRRPQAGATQCAGDVGALCESESSCSPGCLGVLAQEFLVRGSSASDPGGMRGRIPATTPSAAGLRAIPGEVPADFGSQLVAPLKKPKQLVRARTFPKRAPSLI